MLQRLRGPKPPKVWLERKKKGEYVPARHDTGASALLVALYLHERSVHEEDNVGLSKEELYNKAEGLQITKNPFSGGSTQTGPYHYDGWSKCRMPEDVFDTSPFLRPFSHPVWYHGMVLSCFFDLQAACLVS
jgi:hypothetical protein